MVTSRGAGFLKFWEHLALWNVFRRQPSGPESDPQSPSATTSMFEEILAGLDYCFLLVKPDPAGVWRIAMSSKNLSETLEVPPSLLEAGNPVFDLVSVCFERGDYNGYDGASSAEWIVEQVQCIGETSIIRRLPSGRGVKTVAKHGQNGGIVLTFIDVSDLEERESELASANDIFDEVLEEMGQGLVVFSGSNGLINRSTIMNSRLAEMMELPEHITRLGISHDAMLSFFEERGDLDSQSIAKLDNFRKNPGKTGFMNLVYLLPSGRTVQSVGSVRADGTGRIVTFTDISDIVRSEKERAKLASELSHMQRLEAVGQLTGGISHDFNNLLAVILGNAELLQMEFGSDDNGLKDIHSAAKRGAELTQRLLAFSRKQALNPTAINLKHSLEDLRELLKRTLGESIDVRTYSGDDLWRCLADAGQVENAILNLAVNARDAMPKGGTLTIDVMNVTLDATYTASRTEVDAGEYVQISVHDTGLGMTKEVIDNAFDPFYTTKDVGKGSGLGLSMVYGFVKQSKGDIKIDSTPGQGTTVNLFLPRTEQFAEPVKSEPALIQSSMNGKNILVVEDDPDVRAMVVRGLSGLGYRVRAYATGNETLSNVAQDDPVDLLLTDIVLPEGMSGAKLGRELLAQRPSLRILYMSGYAKSAVYENEELDVNVSLLQKPFSLNSLSVSIQNTLNNQDYRQPSFENSHA